MDKIKFTQDEADKACADLLEAFDGMTGDCICDEEGHYLVIDYKDKRLHLLSCSEFYDSSFAGFRTSFNHEHYFAGTVINFNALKVRLDRFLKSVLVKGYAMPQEFFYGLNSDYEIGDRQDFLLVNKDVILDEFNEFVVRLADHFIEEAVGSYTIYEQEVAEQLIRDTIKEDARRWR